MGDTPLTADDLAHMRDHTENGTCPEPYEVLALLDMVDGYKQLVAGLQEGVGGILFDLEHGWQEYADHDGVLDWHPLSKTNPRLWELAHVPYRAEGERA